MTPVCYVHDRGAAMAITREDRAQNDRMFFCNMVSAIFYHHPKSIIGNKEHTDLLWAVTYYSAVDSWKT